jgi:SH3 domain protein
VKKICFAILLLGCLNGTVAAEVGYVTDDIKITLRRGQGTDFKILKMLPSGARLEILQEHADSGYTKVRTQDGVEGWVLSHQLMSEPSAREQLDDVQAELARLREGKSSFLDEIEELREQKTSSEQRMDQLEVDNRKLSQELATIRQASANTLAVLNESKRLRERVVTLEQDLQVLQQENAVLKERRETDWIMVGALLVVVGVAIGFFLPKLRSPRRQRWDDLL